MGYNGAATPPPAAPGWYPDPEGSGSYRYWDGKRWTDAVSSAIPPASPSNPVDDAHSWALAAHMSALLSLVVGLPFIGPLVVYLAKREDPYIRRHAAEALNFNLSIVLYAAVLGVVTVILIFFIVGLLLIPLFVVLAIVWFVCVILASIAAGQGREYRYPLTIRFVR